MAWTTSGDGVINDDAQFIRYGTNQARVGRAGEYNMLGGVHLVEIEVDLVDLPTSGELILSPTTIIPDGAQIEKVTALVTEVTAGTNSNLDFGLIRLDRTTELDYNGLLAAADLWHEAAVGTTTEYVAGTTEAGALVGTVLTNPGLLTASAETAAFTAGALLLRVEYSMWATAPDL